MAARYLSVAPLYASNRLVFRLPHQKRDEPKTMVITAVGVLDTPYAQLVHYFGARTRTKTPSRGVQGELAP